MCWNPDILRTNSGSFPILEENQQFWTIMCETNTSSARYATALSVIFGNTVFGIEMQDLQQIPRFKWENICTSSAISAAVLSVLLSSTWAPNEPLRIHARTNVLVLVSMFDFVLVLVLVLVLVCLCFIVNVCVGVGGRLSVCVQCACVHSQWRRQKRAEAESMLPNALRAE